MSGYENFRGRAKPKPYVPPRPNFTDDQRLAALERIAARIEAGEDTPLDMIEARAHIGHLTAKAALNPCWNPIESGGHR